MNPQTQHALKQHAPEIGGAVGAGVTAGMATSDIKTVSVLQWMVWQGDVYHLTFGGLLNVLVILATLASFAWGFFRYRQHRQEQRESDD